MSCGTFHALKCINNIIIEKISCGLSHSLLLSNEGNIYVFGKFFSGDLEFNAYKPLKVNHSIKFCDITTHWNQEFFAALSKNGSFYVWDQHEWKGEIIDEPQETYYKSYNEIFVNYLKITYQPIKGMLIEFDDSFVRNYNYEHFYEQKQKLGADSYREVFRAKHFENFNATKRLNSMIEKLKRL